MKNAADPQADADRPLQSLNRRQCSAPFDVDDRGLLPCSCWLDYQPNGDVKRYGRGCGGRRWPGAAKPIHGKAWQQCACLTVYRTVPYSTVPCTSETIFHKGGSPAQCWSSAGCAASPHFRKTPDPRRHRRSAFQRSKSVMLKGRRGRCECEFEPPSLFRGVAGRYRCSG